MSTTTGSVRVDIFDARSKLVTTLFAKVSFAVPPAVGHGFFPGSLGKAIVDKFGPALLTISSIEHGPAFEHETTAPEAHIVVSAVAADGISDADVEAFTADGWQVMDFRR